MNLTSSSTSSHILRIIIAVFAILYLLNCFLKIPALNYIGSILLLYIMSQSVLRLPKVNRRVVSGLIVLGALLLIWSDASLLSWISAIMKNANLVTLFICVPMMSMPFFYEDYQGELKAVAQTRMQNLLSFCVLVFVSTHVLGVLISIGAAVIIYELLLPNARLYQAEDIFLMTLTRSYCSAGFWSPAWASVLVVTSQMNIEWLSLIPIGLAGTLIYFLLDMVSIALKIKKDPSRYPRLKPEEGVQVHWKKVYTMLILAGLLIAMIILASVVTPWDLMIIIPLVSISFPILCAVFQKHLPSYREGMGRYYRHSLLKVQNEVTLFAAAGFLGKALELSGVGQKLPGLIPDWLSLYPALLIAFIMGLMIIPSLIGVHPVVTGTALVSAIVPAAIGLGTMTFALTIIVGWLLTIVLSPFSATSLITSGLTGKTSWSISLGMNGRFGLICVVLFSLLISLVGPLL